jgi:hypothetical protein
MTLYGGEHEEIETVIKLLTTEYDHGLVLLQIDSAIKVSTRGFVKTLVEGLNNVRKVEFQQYFHPVSFFGYYIPSEELLIFQAPKDVCRGVSKQINSRTSHFENLRLIERRVDFSNISKYVSEFSGTWFRGISPEVRSASLAGENIQNDPFFQDFSTRGAINNITFPFIYSGAEHRIMVTERSAVVLVENYNDDLSLELGLVLDAKKKIVEKLWLPIEGD